MRERSLADLVAAAASRCGRDVAGEAGAIARLAKVGLFGQAHRLTRLPALRLEILAGLSGTLVENLIEMRDQDAVAWERFSEYQCAIASTREEKSCCQALSAACEPADRVDHVLAHFDHSTELAPSARSCRDDTTLLGVLADWMMDRQQLCAGEEARRLRCSRSRPVPE